MNAEKMIINPPGDKLLLGAHFHTLEDHTAGTFKTNHLEQFREFMKKDRTPDVLLLCGAEEITARVAKPDRYTAPVAVCALKISEALAGLKNIANKEWPLAKFTEYLESYKRFLSADGVALLDNLRHFKLKKILSVDSKKDNRGNFSFGVSLETAGKEDFDPPASLVFGVPVYKFLPDYINLTFELHFTVAQGENPALGFTLKSFTIDEEVEKVQEDVINAVLAECKQEKLWGSQIILTQDDAWKYQANPLNDGDE